MLAKHVFTPGRVGGNLTSWCVYRSPSRKHAEQNVTDFCWQAANHHIHTREK